MRSQGENHGYQKGRDRPGSASKGTLSGEPRQHRVDVASCLPWSVRAELWWEKLAAGRAGANPEIRTRAPG